MEGDVATRILAHALLRPASWLAHPGKEGEYGCYGRLNKLCLIEESRVNPRHGAADEWGRVQNKAPPTTDS